MLQDHTSVPSRTNTSIQEPCNPVAQMLWGTQDPIWRRKRTGDVPHVISSENSNGIMKCVVREQAGHLQVPSSTTPNIRAGHTGLYHTGPMLSHCKCKALLQQTCSANILLAIPSQAVFFHRFFMTFVTNPCLVPEDLQAHTCPKVSGQFLFPNEKDKVS